MFLVLSIIELATRVANVVATAVAVGLKDIACLEKDLRESTS
jgi:hypothetical protein